MNITQIKIENRIDSIISNIDDLPAELIPKVNQSNDFAYPFIEVGFDGTVYLVIRERGIEQERIIFRDLESLLLELFKKISLELAIKEELRTRKSELDYSFDKIKKLQEFYLKKFNSNWNL